MTLCAVLSIERHGFKLTQEYDKEFEEINYTLTEKKTGREITTNSKKYLAMYLSGLLPCLDK